ncbi:MAG: hypothetical protein OXH96_13775 [Spirochaetaceae bacterium]|nr:hypothetical protein [Spirochaetaceae bacterium]
MQFHMSQIDYVVIPGWTTWKGGNYVQYAPSNYLKKWHIRYNEDAQKLAEEEGYDTWAEALVAHWDIIRGVGLETPTMMPWISKLFELEIAQWAEVDLRVVPRLVDDAAWGENIAADEFMLQPGGIDWQRQFRLSEFGSEEWFELAQKMFDFTGDNLFVIGTVGEAPAVLLTNNDLRNVPTEFPVSNTDWKGNLMYWADQLWFDR